MSLAHLQDPDNAKSAYEQAMTLDTKDPAVPLNYAVLLFNEGDTPGAGAQLKEFEARVSKLRQTPGLDADPDVRSQYKANLGFREVTLSYQKTAFLSTSRKPRFLKTDF